MSRKRLKINKFYRKLKQKYFFVMGHAIINRLIGLVNRTTKMIIFSRKLSFSQFKLSFGSMTPEKTDLIEGKQ